MNKLLSVLVLLVSSLIGVSVADEPVIGGRCEGCKYVFVEMPTEISSKARLAPAGQPGEPLTIDGTVTRLDGKPAVGIIVYAYQTDAGGIYPDGSTRHGSLRAWARTDADGAYRFESIRPGSYPNSSIPQHVHMHIIEPGRGTYYIDDIHFDDDPMLTERAQQNTRERGGNGICHPVKDDSGVWHVRRDIVLGKNIPDYK